MKINLQNTFVDKPPTHSPDKEPTMDGKAKPMRKIFGSDVGAASDIAVAAEVELAKVKA